MSGDVIIGDIPYSRVSFWSFSIFEYHDAYTMMGVFVTVWVSLPVLVHDVIAILFHCVG